MDTEVLKSCAHILNVDIVSKASGLLRFSWLADEVANISDKIASRKAFSEENSSVVVD